MSRIERVKTLTPEQEARMSEWADRWIQIGLRTGEADRDRWEAVVAKSYGYAGIPWHGNVVWVDNPFLVAIAAPLAAHLLGNNTADDAVDDAVGGAVGVAVRGAVRGAVDDAIHRAVHDAVGGAVHGAVHDAVGGAVHGAVDGAVYDAVDDAVGGAVRGAVGGAVHGAVGGAVGGAVYDAVHDAVGGAVYGAVDGAVYDAVDDAVGGAVRGAVGGAVHGAVDGAVDGAVYDAVRDAVHRAVDVAVHGAVGVAVGGAVHGAVDDAVHRAVHDAVDDARDAVLKHWDYYIGGQFWPSRWAWGCAYTSFFREVCGLHLPDDLWDRVRAYEETIKSACWWWPHRQFVIVSERPLAIHRERIGSRGWGSHRLHNDDGPAVEFRGFSVYAIHGVRVDERVITNDFTATNILEEKNAEVRRIMMERFGFQRLVREADAETMHADQYGTLFRIPMVLEDLLLVHVINPLDKQGEKREYVLPVHPELRPMIVQDDDVIFGDPQTLTARNAVASTYGLRGEDYQVEVRT